MESQDLDAIKTQLQEQQAKLSLKANKLRGELAGVDEDVARIEAALGVLSGTPLSSASTKLAKKDKRKAPAPSASKAQVIDLMVQELSQVDALQESELKSLIEQKLIESGHSRMGYSLRFKEALSDSKFHFGANGISLTRPSSPRQQMGSQATVRNGHEHINV